ncbi:MAG: glycosyltransferase [Gemmatimonadaceae bacterium]|nr:glycosyltransferase [Gemmatimonadaceae bacterium]
MTKRPVLIYRDRLVYLSERFIVAQGEALRRYAPHYAGVRREPSVETPPTRTTLLCDGSILDLPRAFAFKTLGVLPDSFRRLAALRPELVHAHFGPDGVRAIPIARHVRAPLVVTFHGFDATMHDDALRATSSHAMRRFPQTRRRLFSSAARFIAVSQFVREKLLARGYPSEKIVVHPIGVDTTFFAGRAERDRVVLFVARLVEQKGIADFVRVVGEVRHRHPDLRGVVIGDGPARQSAESLSRELGAGVEFLGSRGVDEVRDWMNRSLVFCVPSRRMTTGAEEGFGLVFAEAQAAGLPVVSYANGGIPEAVAAGETGLLAPDGDWQALAGHLLLVASDDVLRRKFSAAGSARARMYFDLAKQSSALEETYDAVVEEYQRAGR